MSTYSSIFGKIDTISYVSTDLADKLKVLAKYKSKNFVQQDAELSKSMLEIAETHNLFDQDIFPEYLEMKAIFEKLSFLNPVCSRLSYTHDTDPMINVMTDLFKYYKHRVNLSHYNIRINDEVLTEESIEALV